MCTLGGAGRAGLECSVLEEDWQTGQSYTAHWHSLTLVPQHHHRPAVIEAERSEIHWEARRLLQRFLSGAISRNYPHPKTSSTRRLHQSSVSEPPTVGPKVQRGPAHIQKEVCRVTMTPKSVVLEKSERKTVVKMARMPRFSA
ncbi:uncharacterized protein LOC144459434 [Epinephelus lanceolatus]